MNAESDVIDIRDNLISGGWNFRSVSSLQLSYQKDDFATTITGIRRGPTARGGARFNSSTLAGVYEGDGRVDEYITYNWTASYNVNENLTLAARVINVTNERAPEDDSYRFFQWPWYNTFVYPGSAIGRQYYLEATYQF